MYISTEFNQSISAQYSSKLIFASLMLNEYRVNNQIQPDPLLITRVIIIMESKFNSKKQSRILQELAGFRQD